MTRGCAPKVTHQLLKKKGGRRGSQLSPATALWGGQIVASTRIAVKVIILPGTKNAMRMTMLALAPMSNTRP